MSVVTCIFDLYVIILCYVHSITFVLVINLLSLFTLLYCSCIYWLSTFSYLHLINNHVLTYYSHYLS